MPYFFHPSIAPPPKTDVRVGDVPPWDEVFIRNVAEPAPGIDKPLSIRLKRAYTRLNDLIVVYGSARNLIVSSRFRDLVESLEPNVHQWLPFHLIQPSGEKFPGGYWGMHILQAVDCIMGGKDVTFYEQPIDRWNGSCHEIRRAVGVHYRGDDGIVINASAVVGMHLWRDRHSRAAAFMSDDLYDLFVRKKFSGAYFNKVQLA